MNTLHHFLADGTADGQAQSNPMGLLVPMILVFVMMYFVMIRPQKKKQQELQAQINALKSGDTVVTSGGIHGLITNVQEKTATLKIADNVKIKIEKSSVAAILKKSGEPDAEAVVEVEAEVSTGAK